VPVPVVPPFPVVPPAPVVLVVGVVVAPGTAAPPELGEPAGVPAEVPAEEEPEEAPAPELAEEEEFEPDAVVDVLVVVVCDGVEAGGALLVGTVSVGAPEVSAEGEPPPQAETPRARATPAVRAARGPAILARREVTARTSGPEGVHPASAMGAVVQVLLSELVAPIAEAEVLDGPGQFRGRGGQGQEHGDGFERLARVAVQVGPSRVGLDHHLSVRGRRPQAVLLLEPHAFDATSGPQTRRYRLVLG
jgi:hypothetical protein